MYMSGLFLIAAGFLTCQISIKGLGHANPLVGIFAGAERTGYLPPDWGKKSEETKKWKQRFVHYTIGYLVLCCFYAYFYANSFDYDVSGSSSSADAMTLTE